MSSQGTTWTVRGKAQLEGRTRRVSHTVTGPSTMYGARRAWAAMVRESGGKPYMASATASAEIGQ